MAKLSDLFERYNQLKDGKEAELLNLEQKEIALLTYQSNAIENSTLSFEDTKNILAGEISDYLNLREVYEARNLGALLTELNSNLDDEDARISVTNILNWHKLLMKDIRDDIGGRFRSGNEWVKIGGFVGANPEFTSSLISELVCNYNQQDNANFIDNISHFHLEFETIHPFGDGNGRIGRVIINQQLKLLGYPPIVIPSESKTTDYYPKFSEYHKKWEKTLFSKYFETLLIESLEKRLKVLDE